MRKGISQETAISWLEIQILDLATFSGARQKLDDKQIRDLAIDISVRYFYLKITELMLFFFNFRTGKYGRFYGAVDPMIISEALLVFEKERLGALGQLRKREEAEKAQKHESERMAAMQRGELISRAEFKEIEWLFNM